MAWTMMLQPVTVPRLVTVSNCTAASDDTTTGNGTTANNGTATSNSTADGDGIAARDCAAMVTRPWCGTIPTPATVARMATLPNPAKVQWLATVPMPETILWPMMVQRSTVAPRLAMVPRSATAPRPATAPQLAAGRGLAQAVLRNTLGATLQRAAPLATPDKLPATASLTKEVSCCFVSYFFHLPLPLTHFLCLLLFVR